ncbi:MAG: phospholipase D-like domain-containing protein [Desulfobacterales bacterium]
MSEDKDNKYLWGRIILGVLPQASFIILFATLLLFSYPIHAAEPGEVVLNEIAWMGTTASVHDEWIELYNTKNQAIEITEWTLQADDGSPIIKLSGSIPAHGYFLLERNEDHTVPGIAADQIYSGALEDAGERLVLRDSGGKIIDSVDEWHAGDRTTKATMERSVTQKEGWGSSQCRYDGGFGTPASPNSVDSAQVLRQIYNRLGSINVFFNQHAQERYALETNVANSQVNLEERLIVRLRSAQRSIDMTIYDINLPRIVDALIDKAAHGVTIRVITDAKDQYDGEHSRQYDSMRLKLEQMARGLDGTVGTEDDIALFSDSVIFALEDSSLRNPVGLPSTPNDLPQRTVAVGNEWITGRILSDGELKSADRYFPPWDLMHNMFVVIDGEWVWTGSWDFTITGLYGTEANYAAGVLNGNAQHVVELRSPEVANAFVEEFEEMWGSPDRQPDPLRSNFHKRKSGSTSHIFNVGGRAVEVYFTPPGDDLMRRLTILVAEGADVSTHFLIFAWTSSYLPIVDVLKWKWEGSLRPNEGERTGFDLMGIFDSTFWNQPWSASAPMQGLQSDRPQAPQPWAMMPPIVRDQTKRKLHAKTMIIDADTLSDPTVMTASGNWTMNSFVVNDENWLIIHDGKIANQFLQEFYARYIEACDSAILLATDLSEAHLPAADFRKSRLVSTNLNEAVLTRVRMEGAMVRDSNLRGAKMQGAEMRGALFQNTVLADAQLNGADLSEAAFENATLNNVSMAHADIRKVKYEPVPNLLPNISGMAQAHGLAELMFSSSPQGLFELRAAFKNAGLRDAERELTYAIKHSQRLQSAKSGPGSKIDSWFNYVAFELTTEWGHAPERSLIVLLGLIPLFTLVYMYALIKPGKDGIWRRWHEDRVRQDLGGDELDGPLKLRWYRAIGLGFYFSILSAFHIGWKDLNVGMWIAKVQRCEYILVGSGWVRMVSGVQSLISVYLLAIWVLTYFGRPFD